MTTEIDSLLNGGCVVTTAGRDAALHCGGGELYAAASIAGEREVQNAVSLRPCLVDQFTGRIGENPMAVRFLQHGTVGERGVPVSCRARDENECHGQRDAG